MTTIYDRWLQQWPPGTPQPGDSLRVCVPHYSPNHTLDSLLHQLHYLSTMSRVVLVTQSRLSDKDVEFLKAHYCSTACSACHNARD